MPAHRSTLVALTLADAVALVHTAARLTCANGELTGVESVVATCDASTDDASAADTGSDAGDGGD